MILVALMGSVLVYLQGTLVYHCGRQVPRPRACLKQILRLLLHDTCLPFNVEAADHLLVSSWPASLQCSFFYTYHPL